MALSDILQRFRRVWAPPGGPAGSAGIPADQRLELTDELASLLVTLDQLERESAEVLEAARREADAIQSEAEAEAGRIMSEARSRAGRERLKVARRRRAKARRSAETRLVEAQEEAERIRRVAAERERGLVSEVVGCILAGVRPAEAPARGRDAAVVGRG